MPNHEWRVLPMLRSLSEPNGEMAFLLAHIIERGGGHVCGYGDYRPGREPGQTFVVGSVCDNRHTLLRGRVKRPSTSQ